MRKAFTLLCCLGLVVRSLFAGDIADPVRYFLGDRPLSRTDLLLRIDMDVDHDGKKETYLSLSRETNGKAGNMWTVFESGKNGYAVFDDGLEFSPKLFYVGYIKELHRYGLIKYWRAGGEDGSFYAYTFRGRRIVETDMGRLRNLKTLRLREAYSKELFGDGPPFTLPYEVKRIPVTELAEKYGLHLSDGGF